MSPRSGKPPAHGVISVTTLPKVHARKHLAAMTASMNEVHDYGAHGEGQSSRGGFSGSGVSGSAASNAEYSTTNVGGTADSDSQGPSEY